MMEFENEEQAKAWGESQKMSNHDWAQVKIAGEDVILCGTCIPYEDLFWPLAYDVLSLFFGAEFEYKFDPGELRDMFIKDFEEYCNCRFVNIYDQF